METLKIQVQDTVTVREGSRRVVLYEAVPVDFGTTIGFLPSGDGLWVPVLARGTPTFISLRLTSAALR